MSEVSATTPQPVEQSAATAFAEVVSLMARLRRITDGCPWDLQQTLDSIQPHTLEEVYEVFDAIDRRSWPELRDELGDLLLQVLFYAQIANDEGCFNITDVVQGLGAKLVRRHPHIFGDASASSPDDVIATWERVKQSEKTGVAANEGLLASLPTGMPALVEARKIGSKVAKVGFDWPDVSGVFEKLQEEIREVQEELGRADELAQERLEEELGDVLFTIASLGRHLNVDPEQALRKANAKFRRRFNHLEREAAGQGGLHSLNAQQMETLWQQAKKAEKTR